MGFVARLGPRPSARRGPFTQNRADVSAPANGAFPRRPERAQRLGRLRVGQLLVVSHENNFRVLIVELVERREKSRLKLLADRGGRGRQLVIAELSGQIER